MANCTRCNEKLGFLSSGNYCDKCTVENARKEIEGAKKAKELSRVIEDERAARSKTEALERTKRIEAILLTTETAPNLNITKRIEIVTAECAFGMNIFKDLLASVRMLLAVGLRLCKEPCGMRGKRFCMS